MATSVPLYVELHERAQQSPIQRPDWEKYWNFALTLQPQQLQIVLVLIRAHHYSYQNVPIDAIKPLPGNKGVSVVTERLPPLLQQIILHYLNQIPE
jgi:hypothetical protein